MNQKFEAEYGDIEKIAINENTPITKRPAEVDAVKAIVNPLPPARTAEQHHYDMQNEGKELCLRCCDYKFRSEFGEDDRNTERGGTQTICKQCDAERKTVKNQVQRTGRRDKNYQYKAHRKRRKRK